MRDCAFIISIAINLDAFISVTVDGVIGDSKSLYDGATGAISIAINLDAFTSVSVDAVTGNGYILDRRVAIVGIGRDINASTAVVINKVIGDRADGRQVAAARTGIDIDTIKK